jgi:hypothetical protein
MHELDVFSEFTADSVENPDQIETGNSSGESNNQEAIIQGSTEGDGVIDYKKQYEDAIAALDEYKELKSLYELKKQAPDAVVSVVEEDLKFQEMKNMVTNMDDVYASDLIKQDLINKGNSPDDAEAIIDRLSANEKLKDRAVELLNAKINKYDSDKEALVQSKLNEVNNEKQKQIDAEAADAANLELLVKESDFFGVPYSESDIKNTTKLLKTKVKVGETEVDYLTSVVMNNPKALPLMVKLASSGFFNANPDLSVLDNVYLSRLSGNLPDKRHGGSNNNNNNNGGHTTVNI